MPLALVLSLLVFFGVILTVTAAMTALVLDTLNTKGTQLMAQIDDLTALATTIGTDLAALSTEVTSCLADLRVQQVTPAPDLGPVIAKFQAVDTGIKTILAAVTAADPGPVAAPTAPVTAPTS